MMGPFGSYGMGAAFTGLGLSFFLLLILWGIVWKGLGLWHAARRGNQWWFIALLFINTFGILEIVYLFAVLKLKPEELFVTDTKQWHLEKQEEKPGE